MADYDRVTFKPVVGFVGLQLEAEKRIHGAGRVTKNQFACGRGVRPGELAEREQAKEPGVKLAEEEEVVIGDGEK